MVLNKFKIIQVFSNGSVNFCYKSCNIPKSYIFKEKDNKNFYFNIKNLNNFTLTNKTPFSKYKTKYLKTF